KRALDQADRLKQLLTAAGVQDVDVTDRVETAVAALRDHWGVQRQHSQHWIDLDIDAASLEPGKTLAPAAETVELNDAGVSRSHEVVVRVIAERTRDGSTAEHTVLEHTLRPSDVLGQPIVL